MKSTLAMKEHDNTNNLTAYFPPTPAPAGFKTVAKWWVEREPEALELLADPVATFLDDANKLEAISEARGFTIQRVPAPPAFREVGRQEVRAFPLELLAEFYPQNP